jgi:hypothetical protein
MADVDPKPASGASDETVRRVYRNVSFTLLSLLLTGAAGYAVSLMMAPSTGPLEAEAIKLDQAHDKLAQDPSTKGCAPDVMIDQHGSRKTVRDFESGQFKDPDRARRELDSYAAYVDRVSTYVSACKQARAANAWTSDARRDARAAYVQRMKEADQQRRQR